MQILIVGASSGIGRALCAKLIANGHSVWGVARNKEKLIGLQNELDSKNFFWSACDVSQQWQVEENFKKMEGGNFFPETVILGAGIFPKDCSQKFQRSTFNEVFATNFFGAVNFMEIFLDKFIQRGSGRFIAIGSTSAFRPGNRGIAYPASKNALATTIKGFNMFFAEKGIIFTNLFLGPIKTSMWEGKNNFLVSTPEAVADFINYNLNNKKRELWFPFVTTAIFRLTKFIPDKLFGKLSAFFLK